jgi:TolB-like protein
VLATAPKDSLRLAQAICAREPLDEAAARLAMTAAHAAGEQGEVRRQWRRLEENLKRELGAQPSAETAACLAALQSAPAPALPPAIGAVDRGEAPPRTPLRGRRGWVALAVAALLVVGLWAILDRQLFSPTQASARVAVLRFDTPDAEPDAQIFADRLLDEIRKVLNSDQVQALSRTDSIALRGTQAEQAFARLRVGLFLDGTVRREGDLTKVRVFLNDARDHTTLWSKDFEGPAGHSDALQAEIAARTTDVANWALVGTKGGPALDSATLAAFIEARDEMNNNAPVGDRITTLLRQVIAKAPDFARAHSALAAEVSSETFSSIDQSAPLVNEATSEARRALQLEPKNGEAYLALQRVTPTGAWRERQGLLAHGIAVDPDFPYLHYVQSQVFGQVGRNQDAADAAERAVELNPFFGSANINLCARLTYLGRSAPASIACQRAGDLWPHNPIVEITLFYLDLENGRHGQAADRLEGTIERVAFGDPAIETWRRFLMARAAGDVAAARAAAISAAKAADSGAFDRRHAYIALAIVGEVDAALQQAERFYTAQRMQLPAGGTSLDTTLLFVPATASVRRDPRFMALAARIGLADYWRTSGKWPDFCTAPNPPYDCQAVAQKLLSTRS